MLPELVVKIGGKNQGLMDSLKTSEDAIAKFASSTGNSLFKKFLSFDALKTLVRSTWDMFIQEMEEAREAVNRSRDMGVDIEFAQTIEKAAEAAGIGIETVSRMMLKIAEAKDALAEGGDEADKVAEKIAKLGFTAQRFMGMSRQGIMTALIDQFHEAAKAGQITDEQTAAMAGLFGNRMAVHFPALAGRGLEQPMDYYFTKDQKEIDDLLTVRKVWQNAKKIYILGLEKQAGFFLSASKYVLDTFGKAAGAQSPGDSANASESDAASKKLKAQRDSEIRKAQAAYAEQKDTAVADKIDKETAAIRSQIREEQIRNLAKEDRVRLLKEEAAKLEDLLGWYQDLQTVSKTDAAHANKERSEIELELEKVKSQIKRDTTTKTERPDIESYRGDTLSRINAFVGGSASFYPLITIGREQVSELRQVNARLGRIETKLPGPGAQNEF